MKLLTNDERMEMLCFFFTFKSVYRADFAFFVMLAHATRLFIPQYFGLVPIIHGFNPRVSPKVRISTI